MDPDRRGAAGPSTDSAAVVSMSPRSAVLVVGAVMAAVLVRNVVNASHRVLGWAIAATVVAVLLKSAVDVMARWVPRVVAIIVLALTIGGLTGAVVYGVFADLDAETRALQVQGPRAAERLAERDDRIGSVSRDLRLPERAADAFDAVEQRFGIDDDTIAGAVGTVPAYFVGFILTMFLVLYGPGIVDAAIAQQSDRRRRDRWARALHSGVERGRRYIWVAVLQGFVVGAVAYGVAQLWDLPAPTVLGLVAGAAAMVPYIGLLIGAVPIIVLAAGIVDVSAGVTVFVVASLAQVGEALLLRRVIDRRTLHVGPALPVLVGLIGLDVYGIGGALFAIAAAVLLLAIADAAATETGDQPIPIPGDDWVGGDEEPATTGS